MVRAISQKCLRGSLHSGRVHGTPQPGKEGKKRNSEHKFHVPMSSSGGKNKVSVVLVSEQSFGILSKSTTNFTVKME